MSDTIIDTSAIIYVRTNLLLGAANGCRIGEVITPSEGHYIDEKPQNAVIPCHMAIKRKRRLFLSRAFLKALNFDNTKKFEKEFDLADQTDTVLTIKDKDSFVRHIFSNSAIEKTGQTPQDMIWKDGYYDVNIVQTPQNGQIALIGDFETLSNAFMIARMNGNCFVNVELDAENMTSTITLERPQQIGTPRTHGPKRLNFTG